MTHEIKNILEVAWLWQQQGLKMVLASVVSLEGSSYRRPGVRMLWNELGEAVGVVSGGCVEKEIYRQAQQVFTSGTPKMMVYDGRFRLGCEGILYVLLEPVTIIQELKLASERAFKKRIAIAAESYFLPEEGSQAGMGTLLQLEERSYSMAPESKIQMELEPTCFKQHFPPLFQLYIIGAEHDAVALCKAAAAIGWEVTVVVSPEEEKTMESFPGASQMITPMYDDLSEIRVDSQTAIMLMTHSFTKDVQYIMGLQSYHPVYFGLLGPANRREKIIDKVLEFCPTISNEFLEQLHGPAGINIGAESAAEISVSIIAEILSVIRKQQPMELRNKSGNIHA